MLYYHPGFRMLYYAKQYAILDLGRSEVYHPGFRTLTTLTNCPKITVLNLGRNNNDMTMYHPGFRMLYYAKQYAILDLGRYEVYHPGFRTFQRKASWIQDGD